MNRLFVLWLAGCLLLAACASQTAAPTPTSTTAPTSVPTLAPTPTQSAIVLTDGLGRTVTLKGPAQRIVSLAPSNTEILFAVGAGPQVVGQDDFSNYPAEAAALPKVGGNSGNYNQETIVNLKPDLVLAADINTSDQVKALEQLGLTVYLLSNPKDLDGMYQNLRIVAQMTGHTQETDALISSLQARVSAVTSKLASVTAKPTVFYELDASDPNAPFTSGPGTFVDLLISMAGGKNVGAELTSAWAQMSVEKLVVANPDLIILGDSNYGVTVESVAARAGWKTLKAVTGGQVFPFNDDLVSRPGPRLVDGLEAMAALLHPDIFKK